MTSLPKTIGIGYKSQYFTDLKSNPGVVEWIEIHAENYMREGGRPIAQLANLRETFDISVHGVGLSIGGEKPLDKTHLQNLRKLIDWVKPASFSEHLAWSSHGGAYMNDLLPLPYTKETLRRITDHIQEVQDTLGRQMLLENPSSYLAFEESTMTETQFLDALVTKSGCGLLLDINNVFVSAVNLDIDARTYINDYPLSEIGELHLGGHDEQQDSQGRPLLIDSHGSPVSDPVWSLYGEVIEKTGSLPTLIEWDNNIPDWETLHADAKAAHTILIQKGKRNV